MPIIYAHYRKTTNEIFYIGIGKTEKRAYSMSARNHHWNRIVSSDGYDVEILETDLSWELAKEAEVILISFYGRRDLGTGPLANLTAGGDGLCEPSTEVLSRIHSPENTKKRLESIDHDKWSRSEANIKRLTSKENLDKAKSPEAKLKAKQNTDYKARAAKRDYSCCHTLEVEEKRKRTRKENYDKKYPNGYPKKPKKKRKDTRVRLKHIFGNTRPWNNRAIVQYSLTGLYVKEWECGQDVAEFYKWDQSNIVKCLKGKQKSAYGYIWKYKDEFVHSHIDPKEKGAYKVKPVVQMTMAGEFIKNWDSITEASATLDIYTVEISRCCLGKRGSAHGFKWKYKID